MKLSVFISALLTCVFSHFILSMVNAQVLGGGGSAAEGFSANPVSYQSASDQENSFNNQINNFTGAKTIVVPLYDFKAGDFSLPISLNYVTNGVKLSDLAGNFGLKWVLNYGGIITRVVNKFPDERMLPGYSHSRIQNVSNTNTAENAMKLAELSHIDSEPDIFSYSLNDISGKFVFGSSGEVRLIPYQNVVISAHYDAAQNNILSFTIVDDKGVKYFFNIPEETEIETSSCAGYTTALGSDRRRHPTKFKYTSSWHLSKITLPVKTNYNQFYEINFSYEDENIFISSVASSWSRGCSLEECEQNSFCSSSNPNSHTSSYITTKSKRLTGIEDENIRVDFVKHTLQREDISNSFAVEYINIYQKNPENGFVKKVKELKLRYHYFFGGGNDITVLGGDTPYWDENNYSKRLILESVTEVSPELNRNHEFEERSLYTFTYDESERVPTRFSLEQDMWGYYNASQALTIIPKIYIYPYESGINKYTVFQKSAYTNLSFVLDGEERTPNQFAAQLLSLVSVKFPTGGTANFEYEGNDFYYDGANRAGAGIRIKKITTHDGISHDNDIVKEFSYRLSSDINKSSGLLLNFPFFAFPENTHPYEVASNVSPGYQVIDPRNYSEYTYDYYRFFITRLSSPRFFSGSENNLVQAYAEVTEKSSDNSRIVYRYSVPGSVERNADNQQGINCFPDIDGYCDGLFERGYSSYCISNEVFNNHGYPLPGRTPFADLKGEDFSGDAQIPFAPGINYEWNRGLLLGAKYFDKDNFLVKENSFEYRLYYPHGNTSPQYMNGILIEQIDNWKLDWTNDAAPGGMGSQYASIYIYSKYRVMSDVAKVLDKRTEKFYDKNNVGQSKTEAVNYFYGGLNHLKPTKQVKINSNGDEEITESLYAFDLLSFFDLNRLDISDLPESYPQRGYKAMIEKNINSLLRKTTSIKKHGSTNEMLTGSVLNLFDADYASSGYGNLYLIEIKLIPLLGPVLKTTLSDVINENGFIPDSRYKTEIQYGDYDSYGARLLRFTKLKQSTSTIWGYNKQYPVAKVVNSTHVIGTAYTSFETGSGNTNDYTSWNYDLEGVVSVPLSPTGNNCYNLTSRNISYDHGLYEQEVFILSYWSKNGAYNVSSGSTARQGQTINGWTYYEHEITNAYNLIISAISSTGSNFIDELRLYPRGTMMETYTYEPLIGITSKCDFNNNITYYEYDSFGRKWLMRNQYRQILKTFEYAFQQPF